MEIYWSYGAKLLLVLAQKFTTTLFIYTDFVFQHIVVFFLIYFTLPWPFVHSESVTVKLVWKDLDKEVVVSFHIARGEQKDFIASSRRKKQNIARLKSFHSLP